MPPLRSPDSPFPYSQLDESQALLQGQIVRSWMSRQAFRSSADDDGNTIPGTFAEDIRARFLGDGTNAQGEEYVPVQRDLEVGGCEVRDRIVKVSPSCQRDTEDILRLAQGKKMRLDPRELFRKAGCCKLRGIIVMISPLSIASEQAQPPTQLTVCRKVDERSRSDNTCGETKDNQLGLVLFLDVLGPCLNDCLPCG